MCQQPVLAQPNYERPFVVHTDASAYGVGAILLQEGEPSQTTAIQKTKLNPLAKNYASLIQAERNYNVTGIQGRKPRLVDWLRTGVSSGNRPTNVIENVGNTAGIARRLGCLECLGRLSWMPWESSGISEIARATNVRFLILTHGLMIRLADQSDGYVYDTY